MKFNITLTSPTGRPETFVAIEATNEDAARGMKDQLLTQAGSLYPVEQWTVASVVPTPDETPSGDLSIMPMYYPTVDPVLSAEELIAQLHAQQLQ